MDSNYTLRFPRTARQAFGHDVHFDDANPDRHVGMAVLVCCAFVLGLLIGGAA